MKKDCRSNKFKSYHARPHDDEDKDSYVAYVGPTIVNMDAQPIVRRPMSNIREYKTQSPSSVAVSRHVLFCAVIVIPELSGNPVTLRMVIILSMFFHIMNQIMRI